MGGPAPFGRAPLHLNAYEQCRALEDRCESNTQCCGLTCARVSADGTDIPCRPAGRVGNGGHCSVDSDCCSERCVREQEDHLFGFCQGRGAWAPRAGTVVLPRPSLCGQLPSAVSQKWPSLLAKSKPC